MEGDYSESTMKESSAESSHVSIRRLDLSDIDDFMVWVSDDQVPRFCPWEPYSNKEDGINYIKTKVPFHPWYRAMCINNRAVGAVTVTPNSGSDKCRAELGYILASKYWGKGIATQAVKIVINTIFDEWPDLERLEALVDVENVGSQRVLEKAGFKREGVLRKYFIMKGSTRDLIMFSLLSTDPRT
ncbi:Acetyltransferase (GNAT) domain protein [Melia azedarach]|uniref:Acetyltransferase (GNAT) domain protein n=1 Tax=Melia azedarach TaxID=155640 RepID=A0ACC1YGC3_MELAZ|nr:Acetyltransferase (GNAT) domain protein [Melia azedarach]